MTITIGKESDHCIVIRVNGHLTPDDQKEVENRVAAEIDGRQKVKLLVLAERFAGWAIEGDWGDMTFINENDPYMEKIAVVANEKWREQVLMFLGAGVRQARVMFFQTGEDKQARTWLLSETE